MKLQPKRSAVAAECVPRTVPGGTRVTSVLPGSIAETIGIRVGDFLTSLNGHAVHDVIDCWFHQSSSRLSIHWRRPNRGRYRNFERSVRKAFHQALGVELEPFRIQRCRNRCMFCFVHQLPRGLRRELYVRDEDYRLSFLQGNYITCTNLSSADMKRIARMRLSPLYVSVHATDPQVRRRLLGAAEDVRRHLLAQRAQALEVLLALDRDGEPVPEPVGVAEQPRVEEVEQRPQLAEVVLDRRAR